METITNLRARLAVVVLCAVSAPTRAEGPSELAILRNKAIIEFDGGHYAEALEKFKFLVHSEADPFHLIFAYRNLARCHTHVGDSTSAVASLMECWERFREDHRLMPDGVTPVDHAASTVICSDLAELYRAQKRYATALEYYHTQNALLEKSISLLDASRDSLTTPMLHSLENFKIARDFGNAYRIGECLFHLNQNKEALAAYRQVRDRVAKYGYSLGSLSTRGDPALNHAYQIVLSVRIAECYERLGERALAAEEWRKAMEAFQDVDMGVLSHPFFDGFDRRYTADFVRSRLEKAHGLSSREKAR